VQKYLGSVVPLRITTSPPSTQLYSAMALVYIPKGTNARWNYPPISALTLEIGQFERTLIVADEGSLSAT